MEARADDGTLIILDCGTGAHELGAALLAEPSNGPRHGSILVGHTHWDHIQGFPFFSPLFVPSWTWHVYGPARSDNAMETTLQTQMSYAFFPISTDAFGANVEYRDLGEGRFKIGSIDVTARYLNHPAVTLGYRLEVGGVSVVYATDHEPHALLEGSGGKWPHLEDRDHIRFLEGADLVIHDTQYTSAEYASRLGWGHTPAEAATEIAMLAKVRRLVLYHHDPQRNDAAVDAVAERCRARAGEAGSDLEIIASAEGQSIELAEAAIKVPSHEETHQALLNGELAATSGSVVVFGDDPKLLTPALDVLRVDGVRAIECLDPALIGNALVTQGAELIFLGVRSPDVAASICGALRQAGWSGGVPIVVMTTSGREHELAQVFAAGASDYICAPCKATYLRARLRSWLARSRARPNLMRSVALPGSF